MRHVCRRPSGLTNRKQGPRVLVAQNAPLYSPQRIRHPFERPIVMAFYCGHIKTNHSSKMTTPAQRKFLDLPAGEVHQSQTRRSTDNNKKKYATRFTHFLSRMWIATLAVKPFFCARAQNSPATGEERTRTEERSTL